ncbi:MAG: cation-translocating P-type ATPase [Actinomycetota bacterium]
MITKPDQRGPWHAITAAEALEILESSPHGLTTGEAERRLAEHGPNVFEEVEPPSWFVVFLRQFRSPLIYILVAAAVVTAALQEWTDMSVIVAVLLLNAVIGFVQERKADASVRALMQLAVPKARVVRDGREAEIDGRGIVPGDLVLLESGARVPADLRLVSVQALSIDESLLTGESDPVAKHTRAIDADLSLADRGSVAFAGTTVTRGRGEGLVVATGEDTEIGGIAELIRAEPETATPLGQRMDRLAKVIGLAVLLASLAVFVIGLARGGELTELFLAAVALAVAAIPEGLPIVVTIALAIGVTRMARRQAIVRRLPAVETLGSATVIGSDKTGTLTENRMTVQQLWSAGRFHPLDEIQVHSPRTDHRDWEPAVLTLLTGVLTNEARLYGDDHHGDPTEVALLVAAADAGFVPDQVRDAFPVVSETPFEPELRFSASLRRVRGGEALFVKGAPEQVLSMCDASLGHEDEEPLDERTVYAAAAEMAASGLRILAAAVSRTRARGDPPLDTEAPTDLVFVGLVGMKDPPRKGVRQAIEACRRASVRVIMITGDHSTTASSIAAELGIEGSDRVLTGAELDRLDGDTLRERVRDVSVFARVSPEGKLRIVRALQADGEVVAVTGDGVNDAPALKSASIGVAMGQEGTDVAREAAEIVLSDDNFVSIVSAIDEGRRTFDNIRRATFFLVSTAVATIIALLAGVAAGWPLVMLPAQLLWLNLVTNGLQDVALAFERGERNILDRPPRGTQEGVISTLLWQRTAITGIVMAIGTLAMFRWELDRSGSLTAAQTVALTTMVTFMALQAGNARSDHRSVFTVPLRANPFLVLATAGSFAVHIGALYFPGTQLVLRVQPLDLDAWVRVVAVAAAVLVVVEVEKAIRRWRSGAAAPESRATGSRQPARSGG